MVTTGVVGLLGLLTWFVIDQTERSLTPLSNKVSNRLQQLWDIAQSGMQEKKYLRAEKALLTILKLDKTNAAAYNRLGILYSRQKEYKDAIECFEIASSISPTASSLHNLGLIYFETENYEKASQAFESALKLEDSLAARHIAYAKVQEKLGNHLQTVSALETAVKLEPSVQSLRLLADAYERAGVTDRATSIRQRIKRREASATAPKRIKRPRRVTF
jgi:tetratricopeptide (TPR) repeat protein